MSRTYIGGLFIVVDVVDVPGQTKVGNLYDVALCDQDVSGCQVSVYALERRVKKNKTGREKKVKEWKKSCTMYYLGIRGTPYLDKCKCNYSVNSCKKRWDITLLLSTQTCLGKWRFLTFLSIYMADCINASARIQICGHYSVCVCACECHIPAVSRLIRLDLANVAVTPLSTLPVFQHRGAFVTDRETMRGLGRGYGWCFQGTMFPQALNFPANCCQTFWNGMSRHPASKGLIWK